MWAELRASLWFVPGVMIACSIVLAFGLVELDAWLGREWLSSYPLIFGVGTGGSRGMLTAIASSMLTVATLAFSLTLNAVTQASNQFTPRIFRNFLRDTANQFVLGYFVSVFAFCLIVLRTIRSEDDDGAAFVPSIAVVSGLVLAVGGIFVLIFFIHHIAASLQINRIIDGIVDETKGAIDALYPSRLGEGSEVEPEALEPDEDEREWIAVRASNHGYLQRIDQEGLMKFAEERNSVMKVNAYIGDFVGTGVPLAAVKNGRSGKNGSEADDASVRKVNELFSIERQRTIEQDAAFGIRQIVDIALKALSPGVNDTTTAVTCVDGLGELVADLSERRFPEEVRRSDNGSMLVVKAPNFEYFVSKAFDQIRISGRGNVAVLARLARALLFATLRTRTSARRRVLEKHLDLTREEARQTLESGYEQELFAAGEAEARDRLAVEG